MFERFTDRARRVVVIAREEARLLDHDYIGTEHLLLGLLHDEASVAARALDSLGVDLEVARQAIRDRVGSRGRAPEGHIPFTPEAKKVLELSLREALQLGHNYIGTEHILLGIVRQETGLGGQVLLAQVESLSAVREEVLQMMATHSDTDTRRRLVTSSSWAPHLCLHSADQLVWEPAELPRADGGPDGEPEPRSAVVVRCDGCGQVIGVLSH